MKEHLGLYSTITVVILRLYFIKVVIYLVIIGIFKCLQWNFVKSKINLLFQSWIQCSIGEMLLTISEICKSSSWKERAFFLWSRTFKLLRTATMDTFAKRN